MDWMSRDLDRHNVEAIDEHPDWSRDGSLIAFSGLDSVSRSFTLFVVHPNGTGRRKLALPWNQ